MPSPLASFHCQLAFKIKLGDTSNVAEGLSWSDILITAFEDRGLSAATIQAYGLLEEFRFVFISYGKVTPPSMEYIISTNCNIKPVVSHSISKVSPTIIGSL